MKSSPAEKTVSDQGSGGVLGIILSVLTVLEEDCALEGTFLGGDLLSSQPGKSKQEKNKTVTKMQVLFIRISLQK
jgi:hypothetical protein